MNWGSFSEFLAMGGYAPYVWGSYAVTAALMIVEVARLASRRRSIVARLRRARKLEEATEA